MNKEDREIMGKRIRSERIRRGITQGDLAKLLNMHRANISNYESGRTIPPGNIIVDLADIFDVETDYLLARSGKDNYDPEIYEIKKILKKLSKDEKIKVLNIIKIIYGDQLTKYNFDV